jgi:hypothetical protein
MCWQKVILEMRLHGDSVILEMRFVPRHTMIGTAGRTDGGSRRQQEQRQEKSILCKLQYHNVELFPYLLDKCLFSV